MEPNKKWDRGQVVAERQDHWTHKYPRESWALSRLESWPKNEILRDIEAKIDNPNHMAVLWKLANELEVSKHSTAEPCSRCGRSATATIDIIEPDNKVTPQVWQPQWPCSVCDSLVCRWCTLTVPDSSPRIYYEDTFCSKGCWKKAGCPDE